MADSFGKRSREAKKRLKREMKAERKRLRKEGLIKDEPGGLFLPGEPQRPVVDASPQPPPPPEPPPA